MDARIVCWNEPTDETFTNNVVMEMKAERAIMEMKVMAGQRGFTYKSDAEALQDFMVVHWAWIKRIEIYRPYWSVKK